MKNLSLIAILILTSACFGDNNSVGQAGCGNTWDQNCGQTNSSGLQQQPYNPYNPYNPYKPVIHPTPTPGPNHTQIQNNDVQMIIRLSIPAHVTHDNFTLLADLQKGLTSPDGRFSCGLDLKKGDVYSFEDIDDDHLKITLNGASGVYERVQNHADAWTRIEKTVSGNKTEVTTTTIRFQEPTEELVMDDERASMVQINKTCHIKIK